MRTAVSAWASANSLMAAAWAWARSRAMARDRHAITAMITTHDRGGGSDAKHRGRRQAGNDRDLQMIEQRLGLGHF